MVHYFWTLCPNDIKDGDTFTVNIEQVTCTECLAQVDPFTDTSAIDPEADSASFHGHKEGTAV